MKVDVAAPAVIGGIVKEIVDALHRGLCYLLIEQITLREFNRPGCDVVLDIFQPAAAEIIDHAYCGSTSDKRVNEMRTDKGRSTCYKGDLVAPIDHVDFAPRNAAK